jgi:hypothetical protein
VPGSWVSPWSEAGQCPVPDNETVCVPDCALSVIFKVAERDPLVFGLKLTLIVQLLLLSAASELPQV